MGEMQLACAGNAQVEVMVPTIDQALVAAAEMAVMEMVRFDAGNPELKSILTLAEAAASCSLDGFRASASNIALATLAPGSGAAGAIVACALAVVRAGKGHSMLSSEGLHSLNRTLLSSPASPASQDIDDLAAFMRRADIPALAHAALAHAHLAVRQPFQSGNGRTARTVSVAMLRVAGVTTTVPIPLSAGLVGNPRGYQMALKYFQRGDAAPVMELLTEAAFICLDNAALLAEDVAQAVREHDDLLDGIRSPAAHQISRSLISAPALTAAAAMRMTGASESAAYRALDQLTADKILAPAGKVRGATAWTAPRIVTALENFLDRAVR